MDATYDLHADVLRVLADRHRLEIIHLLGTGPRDAAGLASGIGIDEATVWRHLSVLTAAGLVEARRSNGAVGFALSDPEVTAACELMRGVVRRRLERLAHRPRKASPPTNPGSHALPVRHKRGS